MATVADTAHSLRETLKVADALRRVAPHVQLRKNGVELCGPCPRCGGDDRFYITKDGKHCACRQCHTQRMDVAGLVAWALDVSMHEAVDVLSGTVSVSRREVVSVSRANETETSTQPATWRTDAATRAENAHRRLFGDTETAAAARAYLLSRGLMQDTWNAFTLGYERVKVPDTNEWSPAICWPVTHETSGETVAIRYRFLETQHVNVNGKVKDIRFTSLYGSRTSGRLFGASLLPVENMARWRCLVVTEGEFNAVSVWQACNVAGVDVLSFGSESQRTLPAWAIDLASRYGTVVTWVDSADKALEVAQQLPQAVPLRSLHSEDDVKLDANALLMAGKLGGLVQTARLRGLPAAQHDYVLWDLWDAWQDSALDAGQVKVGRQLAHALGRGASWT